MFEAVLTVCLAAAGPCREVLLPGHEAATRAACEAALPARAGCRPAGPALDVAEVAPGVFVHPGRIEEPDAANLGDVANLGFVVGQHSVAVIDAGGSAQVAEALWRAIRARTALPVSHLVLTHMHPDHVLGARSFAGAAVVGHAGLDRALADRRANYEQSFARLIGARAFIGSGVPAVDIAVTGTVEIDLGGRLLEVTAWPPAHSGTDVTVLDRQSGTLFAGDLLFDRHAPALDGSLRGWQAVLETLAARAYARVVPGHGGPVLDWPEGAAPLRRYLAVLARDTRAALDAGERLGVAVEHIAAREAPRWQLFDAYNARNATVAFTELEWE